MLVLDNVFQTTVNKFFHFYGSLSNEARFVFFAIIALLIILVILVFVLVDQVRNNKKIMSKNIMASSTPNNDVKEETLYDEENEKTRNLQEITQKMQAVINNRTNDVDNYEKDQEENSIISYEELLKAAGKAKEEPERLEEEKIESKFEYTDFVRQPKVKDENVEPKVEYTNFANQPEPKEEKIEQEVKYTDFVRQPELQEEKIEQRIEYPNLARQLEPNEVIEEKKPVINHTREDRFRSSDFISPIFGVQNNMTTSNNVISTPKIEEPIIPEETIKVYADDDVEILTFGNEEEQFLMNLKNLRNDLE